MCNFLHRYATIDAKELEAMKKQRLIPDIIENPQNLLIDLFIIKAAKSRNKEREAVQEQIRNARVALGV